MSNTKKKVVSIRLSNSSKWRAPFQISHDFLNSHGRKRSDIDNYSITMDKNGTLIKEHFQRDLKHTKEIHTLFNRHDKLNRLIPDLKKEIKINYADESKRELLQETLQAYKDEVEAINVTIKEYLKKDSNIALKHYGRYLEFEKRAKDDWKSVKGRAMQSNTNLFINGIITFGNEESNLSRLELDEIDQNELDRAAYNAVERLVKENGVKVLYIVKHLDESQIHYHYALENYNFTTHKTVAVSMRSKSYLKSTQDLVAEEFKHLGFIRGKGADVRLSEYLDANSMSQKDFNELSYTNKQNIYKEINSKRIADYKQSTIKAKDDLYLQTKVLHELESKKQTLQKHKGELEHTMAKKVKEIVYKDKPSREVILKRVVALLKDISKFELQFNELKHLELQQDSLATENETLSVKNKRLSNSLELQRSAYETLVQKYTQLEYKNTTLSNTIKELEQDITALSKEYRFDYKEWKLNRQSAYHKRFKPVDPDLK